jgi:hypothetical protein
MLWFCRASRTPHDLESTRGWAFGNQDSLRTEARSLHLWTLPAEVSLASSNKAWDQDGNLWDPEIAIKLRRLGSGLVDGHTALRPPNSLLVPPPRV